MGHCLRLTLAAGLIALSLPVVISAQTIINPNGSTPFIISSPGSYVLGGDVSMSTHGDCIRIQAHNVTLDLGGHRIRGTTAGGGIGVRQTAGHGARVLNGWAASFGGSGIVLLDHATVENVTVRENRGSGVQCGVGAHVFDVTALGNRGWGIQTAAQSLVESCVAVGNNLNGDKAGISVLSASEVRGCIANANSPDVPGAAFGIVAYTECTVTGNTADDNVAHTANHTGAGIWTDSGCTVTGNTCRGNIGRGDEAYGGRGIGIHVGDDSTVIGNTCQQSSIAETNGMAIGIQSGDRCMITRNVCSYARSTGTGGDAAGIEAGARCLIRGNLCSDNDGNSADGATYGIHVGADVWGGFDRVEGNHCVGNDAYYAHGIHLEGTEITLPNNSTIDNTGTLSSVGVYMDMGRDHYYGDNVSTDGYATSTGNDRGSGDHAAVTF
ncbi:hypothetical protein JXA47_07420 [Candidatus Sumerlaeota bacterium]|nr:hypothetical protein [Candidatus Sumerlaeota bacterium]